MKTQAALPGAEFRLQLAQTVPLGDFLASRKHLSIDDRRLLTQEAIGLLEQVYVHLPFKRYLYGIDPVQRLRTLMSDLSAGKPKVSGGDDLGFHAAMVSIFTSLCDLHTGYYLPTPFRHSLALLPLQIERCFGGNGYRYVVSRAIEGFPGFAAGGDFAPGAEILEWNGLSIERAVWRESRATPGATECARRARGLARLTTRALAKCLPPDRETVSFVYRQPGGRKQSATVAWRVAQLPPGLTAPPAEGIGIEQAIGQELDLEAELYRIVKRPLMASRGSRVEGGRPERPPPEHVANGRHVHAVPSRLPIFEAEVRRVDGHDYGAIRIRSFQVADPQMALDVFIELVEAMPKKGLVIDVRDNPGGVVEAAERLLQVLTDKPIQRARMMFRITPWIQRLCTERPHEFGAWLPSLKRSQRTGAPFSAAIPLGPDALCNDRQERYAGPVVLIINALSYSATDMFAAGFQDHEIGKILGTDASTGGGGANMWRHSGLRRALARSGGVSKKTWTPSRLPAEADFHVALRRSIRVGRSAGLEIEDFGVETDEIHRMSRRDVLEGNVDLFAKAVSLLVRDQSK